MNFRDLIDRYKTGTVTEEEKRIVESEIEKCEAVNDYLSEQLMDMVSHSNSGEKERHNKSEAKKIRNRINKKLAFSAASAVAAAAVLYCVVQFVLFPFINNMYYNPVDGRKNVIGIRDWGQMSIDMSVFSELHLPGYETPFVFSKPEGLGVYDLTIYQYDTFHNYSETVFQVRLVRGNLQFSLWDMDCLGFNWVQSVYGEYTDDEKLGEINGVALKELSRLPESSRVKAYLFFENSMDMQELDEFIKHNSVQVLWAGIKCYDNESFWYARYGFSPMGKRTPLSVTAYDAVQYSLLELDHSEPFGGIKRTDSDKLNAQSYETHFTSMLEYMSGRNEFMQVLGYGYDYSAALEYVRENGVMCNGVVVCGSLQEIKALTENPLIKYTVIDDVMVSAFSRK